MFKGKNNLWSRTACLRSFKTQLWLWALVALSCKSRTWELRPRGSVFEVQPWFYEKLEASVLPETLSQNQTTLMLRRRIFLTKSLVRYSKHISSSIKADLSCNKPKRSSHTVSAVEYCQFSKLSYGAVVENWSMSVTHTQPHNRTN